MGRQYVRQPVVLVGYPYERTEAGKGTIKVIKWDRQSELPEYASRITSFGDGKTYLVIGVDRRHSVISMVECVK